MSNIKSNLAVLKISPGRSDDHLYKRTYSLDTKLSPVELDALRTAWKESDFNSMAAYVRHQIYGGNEKKIDFYFEEKQQDRILAAKYLAELNKQGKNLNQIAKQLSSKTDFTKQETKLLVDDLKNTLLAIQEIKDKFSPQKKI